MSTKKPNKRFNKAKRNKKDDFFTLLPDIENEVKYYRGHFKNKVVYLNCDDPEESNFWKYFKLNFKKLGLKELVATHYDPNGGSYVLRYNGQRGRPRRSVLKDGGDFRSEECIEILKEADIVVTNPPFSLFREYVAQLIKYNKKFLIIGNGGAVTYKEIFHLITDGKVWLGYNTNKTLEFRLNKDYTKYSRIDEDGNKYGSVPGISWFTNLSHKKRNDKLILSAVYVGNEKQYPKYDNFDKAIEVGRVQDIPADYNGVMGVPPTFLCKWNPDQFEIMQSEEYRKWMIRGPNLNGKTKYSRLMIKNKNPRIEGDDDEI